MKKNPVILLVLVLLGSARADPAIRSAAEPDGSPAEKPIKAPAVEHDFEVRSGPEKTLIYAGDRAYPPFEFIDDRGRPAGFNIDLVRELERELGINVAFELLPWREVRLKIAAGKADFSSMFYLPEREEKADFSSPHSLVMQAVFARKDSPPFSGLNDFKGRRVAVQDGDLAHDFMIRQGLQGSLILTENPEKALALLEEGSADFSLAGLMQGYYWIEKNGWKNIRVADPRLLAAEYCFAAPKGSRPLLQMLESGMIQLRNSGQYRRIYDEWLGSLDPDRDRDMFVRNILIAAFTALILMVIAIIIIALLELQIHKKTSDLREANRTLQESRLAALNMMEDAIQAKKRLELTQFALDHCFDEAFWIRPDGSFAYFNKAACQMLGYSPEELAQLSVPDIDPDFTKEKWPSHWEKLKEAGSLVFETRHRTRDGKIFPVEIHATHMKYGDEEYTFVFAHNITNRKETEQNLLNTVKELKRWQAVLTGREERVLELKREVNELLKQLGSGPKYGNT